ncbi:hypothetical protein BCR33DRAFT_717701 [Rhizoclosmatium globosum]|uniref:Uncharacterized protein n=1 Tax=Rhizoclosmatium globosum TaxID=329046 RepID=A0A1Y2C900_9FUNG|nr:hypothetical protein BCR33DRAFT_717701 [Rhizoclosmatium globosum]|eukprot:ORY43502.1 hypothetical protein BCR33DRAFT_717701 [Rhizoclosmatium globosum]
MVEVSVPGSVTALPPPTTNLDELTDLLKLNAQLSMESPTDRKQPRPSMDSSASRPPSLKSLKDVPVQAQAQTFAAQAKRQTMSFLGALGFGAPKEAATATTAADKSDDAASVSSASIAPETTRIAMLMNGLRSLAGQERTITVGGVVVDEKVRKEVSSVFDDLSFDVSLA